MNNEELKNKNPQIRFSGFSDEWVEKNYKEVFDTSVSNNTFSRAELTSEKTSTKNVHYGDILIKYNSILNVKKDEFPFIPDNVKVDSKNFLKNGDIVFADTAEDETCGKAVEITDLKNENVLAGLHTFVARPKLQFQEKYLGYFINSPAYHNQLIPYMQGTKVTSISKTNVQKTAVRYPNTDEQSKIGDLFSQIDSLILSTQKEHEKLVSLKKCMLQKMFPKKGSLVPEIRFKGFSGDWEREIMGNISNVKDGTHATHERVEKGFLLLSAKNILNNNLYISEEESYISEADYSLITANGFPKKNDILLSCVGSIGRCCIFESDEKIAFQRSVIFIRSKNINVKFLSTLIQSSLIQEQISSFVNASTIGGLYIGAVEKLNIIYPANEEEQQKIGSYFQNLDNLISKQSAELEKLKNVKQTLLSKMFV